MKNEKVNRTIEDSNAGFYTAFESLSIEKMEQVWKHSDDITCIHPGWEMFTSWTAVRESWVTIFQNTRSIKFFVTNIKVKAFDKIAIVVCLENINSVLDEQNSFKMGVFATNIFEKQSINDDDNAWLMMHHHGSAVANYMIPNISDI
ncbi:MAG TPA: nuclear transport factor 2 family protein [Nitrososphaeraceae archaeon]